MYGMDGRTEPDDHVPTKRKVLIVGSIALLTGALAGAAYISSVMPANACSTPPCPAPGPAPPSPSP